MALVSRMMFVLRKARPFPSQHGVFSLIQLAVVLCVCWLWFHLPIPGVAVAILAVVAAAMSVHGNMHGWQKAVWIILIGCLLVVELRSIRKDRTDTEKTALADRAEQNNQFKAIREAQDADFRKTADGLKSTIEGIVSTLKSVNRTESQTKPHADLHFTQISVADQPEPFDGRFSSDVPYRFRSEFVNAGNADGLLLRVLLKIYVGKPDDRDEQLKLVDNFNGVWERTPRDSRPSSHPAGDNGFYHTVDRVFTGDEITSINNGETIYYLRRLEYSDRTGRWVSENCQHIQVADKRFFFRVTHTCVVFNRNRARAL